jgi:hypothetical protein
MGMARRAAMVLNSGARTLAHRSVNISVHRAPAHPSAPTKQRYEDWEIVEQAEQIIIKELKGLLEKDVMERVVATSLRKVAAEEKAKRVVDGSVVIEQKPVEKKGIQGLSFKKQNKRVREEIKEEAKVLAVEQRDEEEDEENDAIARPTKKRKKDIIKKASKIAEDDIESEDDEPSSVIVSDDVKRKRASSQDIEDTAPVKKRLKKEQLKGVAVKQKKIQSKKKSRKARKDAVDHLVLPDDLDFDIPDVNHVRLTPSWESSLSPSRSPSPDRKPPPRIRLPTPPPDPLQEGLCEDDEDLYFAKLALLQSAGIRPPIPEPSSPSTQDPSVLPPFRKHFTGSARTEGYYKISHAEKSAYVAQYALRSIVTEEVPQVDAPQPQHVTSSRSNRANARRRAQGLEEINQVQRAVALSKGETAAAELSFKFNQLQTRKKHLRFARSPIHDWGLYAMERISRGEMVIEYVGEIIRAQVADKREKAYERQGIGSSYLFRIDEDLVVDATKKGNLGSVKFIISHSGCRSEQLCRRLINHSCDPNCTAKIITINSEKKIVIYAKMDIELGDEITYGKFSSVRYTPPLM